MESFIVSFWPAAVVFVLGVLVVLAVANEGKLIDFEDRCADAIKRHVRKVRRNLLARELAKDGLTVTPIGRK